MTTETFTDQPDAGGHFGPYGGRFVSETLIHALDELERSYRELTDKPAFIEELDRDLAQYVGRPTPLYFAERWTEQVGGARIYLKREDLNHTGAHKVNNTIGQGLLAKYSGKRRIIAETGAGQHGVASATIAARLGLECQVYMGEEDVHRQSLNVYRMKLLGAEVIPVTSGSRTLKDAMNEAMRDWVTNVDDTFYIIGTVAGPHPYPMLVRDFQAVIVDTPKAPVTDPPGTVLAPAQVTVFRDNNGHTVVGVQLVTSFTAPSGTTGIVEQVGIVRHAYRHTLSALSKVTSYTGPT